MIVRSASWLKLKSYYFRKCCEENKTTLSVTVCEKVVPRLNKHDDVIEWNFMKIASPRNEELVAPLLALHPWWLDCPSSVYFSSCGNDGLFSESIWESECQRGGGSQEDGRLNHTGAAKELLKTYLCLYENASILTRYKFCRKRIIDLAGSA